MRQWSLIQGVGFSCRSKYINKMEKNYFMTARKKKNTANNKNNEISYEQKKIWL